jgi:hypothetical protein
MKQCPDCNAPLVTDEFGYYCDGCFWEETDSLHLSGEDDDLDDDPYYEDDYGYDDYYDDPLDFVGEED